MRHSFLMYIGRRLVTFAFMLVLVSFLIFSLLYLSPGSPIDILLGGMQARDPVMVQALEHKYHLDEPFLTQYWLWAKGVAHFDFGESISTTLAVSDEILVRLPITLFLGIYAFVLTQVFGILLGIAAALRKGKSVDRGIVAASIVGLSTPVFVGGVLLLYLFAVIIPWFPTFGAGDWFVDRLHHLTLPAIAIATHAATLVKHTRASVIGVLDNDYVTFARARGLSRSRVTFLYALRNGMVPIVTLIGLSLGYLIVGGVIVEVTFSVPGLGQLLVQSATNKDLPMLQGVALLLAFSIMVGNLIADLLYMAADPRVRVGRRTA